MGFTNALLWPHLPHPLTTYFPLQVLQVLTLCQLWLVLWPLRTQAVGSEVV